MKNNVLILILVLLSFLLGLFNFTIISFILLIIAFIMTIKNIKSKDILIYIALGIEILCLVFYIFIFFTTFKVTSSYIDKARIDTFISTAQGYTYKVRNGFETGGFICDSLSSVSVSDGDYYVEVNSKSNSNDLYGSKSSWNNLNVEGYVKVKVQNGQYKYFIVLVDEEGHGIDKEVDIDEIKRDDVKENGANYFNRPSDFCVLNR